MCTTYTSNLYISSEVANNGKKVSEQCEAGLDIHYKLKAIGACESVDGTVEDGEKSTSRAATQRVQKDLNMEVDIEVNFNGRAGYRGKIPFSLDFPSPVFLPFGYIIYPIVYVHIDSTHTNKPALLS